MDSSLRAAARRNTKHAKGHTDDTEEEEDSSPKINKTGSTPVKYSGSVNLKTKISPTRPLHASLSEPSIPAPTIPRPRPRPAYKKKKEPEPQPEPEKEPEIQPEQVAEPQPEPHPESKFITHVDGYGSDLTPLTSPNVSPVQIMKPLPPPKPKTPKTRKRRKVSTSPSTSTLPWQSVESELWSRKSLGVYVWVLIDDHARVFNPEEKKGRSRERLWWPGKVSSPIIT